MLSQNTKLRCAPQVQTGLLSVIPWSQQAISKGPEDRLLRDKARAEVALSTGFAPYKLPSGVLKITCSDQGM